MNKPNGYNALVRALHPQPQAEQRPLDQIAQEIRADWKNVNYAAEPYLSAMCELRTVTDLYGCDDAKSIVLYFLSNASSWRGEVAKRIKKELNDMIKRGRR